MRFINIRQLLRSFNKEVKDLPFTVTRLGQPLVLVSAVVESKKIEKIISEPPTVSQTHPRPLYGPTNQIPTSKCSVPSCYEEATGTGKVYQDGEWVSKPMCNKHIISSLKEYLKAT